MKTTIDLPDDLFKKLKLYAKQRQRSFRDLVIESLKRIVIESEHYKVEPEWARCFGRFAGSKAETAEIQSIIDRDLSQVDREEWR